MKQRDLLYYQTIKDFKFYSTQVNLRAKESVPLLLGSFPEYQQYFFTENGDTKVYFFAGNVTFSNKNVCLVMHPNKFTEDHVTLFMYGVKDKDAPFDLYNAILACH